MIIETTARPIERAPELSGQTVVVIGSAGIGLETARRARAEGAKVILTGRNPERLQHAASELGAMSTATFDANDSAALEAFFEHLDVPVDHVMVTAGRPYYSRLADMGWRLDADVAPADDFRLIQLTPPGSGCSVQFGTNLTSATPGSAQGLYLIVADINATRDELIASGVEVSEAFHEGTPGARFHAASGRVSGPAPDRGSYGSFASFSDPDGNGWLLQEVTTRLPGRIDSAATSFVSANDLASALRRAAAAHGKHEERTGEPDPNWPDWYAEYMVAEQAGKELPS